MTEKRTISQNARIGRSGNLEVRENDRWVTVTGKRRKRMWYLFEDEETRICVISLGLAIGLALIICKIAD